MDNSRESGEVNALEQFKAGDHLNKVPVGMQEGDMYLERTIQEFADQLNMYGLEPRRLRRLAERSAAGFSIEDLLKGVSEDLRQVIPYNRIGLALIEKDSQSALVYWQNSDQPEFYMLPGYVASIEGGVLKRAIETGRPQIIGNLELHPEQKPELDSLPFIVSGEMRSSLTCPLVSNGRPLGFLLFSSVEPGSYTEESIELYETIARQFAIVLERGLRFITSGQGQIGEDRHVDVLQSQNDWPASLFGVAAHDMRNPLGLIITSAQLLLKFDKALEDAERQDLLNGILDSARHMMELISDLLDVTQIESGKIELFYESFDLGEFIEEIVYMQAKIAKEKETNILCDVSQGENIWADKLRLRQVIDNLISNAIKYSPHGSEVQIRAIRNEQYWLIEVIDQGPGITENDREKLFQPFGRLSARPTGREKSTGLGLAITRWIIEAHHGEIGVDSVPGNGSKFWFKIPNTR